jgi:hypothetical protein
MSTQHSVLASAYVDAKRRRDELAVRIARRAVVGRPIDNELLDEFAGFDRSTGEAEDALIAEDAKGPLDPVRARAQAGHGTHSR